MTRWPTEIAEENGYFRTKQELLLQILSHRAIVHNSKPEEQLEFYTGIIGSLLGWIAIAVARAQTRQIEWQDLVAYQLFISAKELYAAERAAGIVFYAQGWFTHTALRLTTLCGLRIERGRIDRESVWFGVELYTETQAAFSVETQNSVLNSESQTRS